jgi:hypothetical protein
MNKLCIIFIISLLFFSCSSILQERASWDFMQNAEFKIGLPIKNNNIYYLSFSCDLTKYNSAPLVINKSYVKIKDNEINIYLYYTLSNKNNNIENIKLGKLNVGKYIVNYINKDNSKYYIGEINIE